MMYLEELKDLINRYENGIITLEQAKANTLLLDSRGNQDVYSCDYFAVRHIISKLSRLIAENQNEDFVVYIEQGRGDNMIVKEINLLDVLKPCVGRQISLKLTDEEDGCNE